jgi:hypothetical protein
MPHVLEPSGSTITEYALPDGRLRWISHPVVGEPSYDAFQRRSGNPLLTGTSPYEWPVNGSLFIDSVSGYHYAYVGMYPRGYWPLERPDQAAYCHGYRSCDGGESWEDIGDILRGSADQFDGDGVMAGAVPDVTVCLVDGVYHMLYDWANPGNTAGGLAHAQSDSPEGPFVRSPHPIHLDTDQEPLLGQYVRAYAGTLIRRANDWLILCMMSTPGNGGGTWAMVAMTSSRPDSGYSEPEFLLWPQSDRFHPAPLEFFPAFVHEGVVYAPTTSVARNRNYQELFAAPLENAHTAGAWNIAQHGSVWHSEAVPNEHTGIWGQTLACAVDKCGTLHAMFHCKTAEDRGTVNLARRPWDKPFRDRGFVISAPNADNVSMTLETRDDVIIHLAGTANGPFSILWGHRGPIGPDRPQGAEGTPHSLSKSDCLRWTICEDAWELTEVSADGLTRELASGPAGLGTNEVDATVEHTHEGLTLSLGGILLWSGETSVRSGRVGIVSHAGTVLDVTIFDVIGDHRIETVSLLCTDGTMGSGAAPEDWELVDDPGSRFGIACRAMKPGAVAKWSFEGSAFRVYTTGRDAFDLLLDGEVTGEYGSDITIEVKPGRHAVTMVAHREGVLVDSLDFLPSGR